MLQNTSMKSTQDERISIICSIQYILHAILELRTYIRLAQAKSAMLPSWLILWPLI